MNTFRSRIFRIESNYQPFLIVFSLLFITIGCEEVNKSNQPKQITETSLKEAFQNEFLIGTALNENQIFEIDSLAIKLVKKELNSITPENCMKWMFHGT